LFLKIFERKEEEDEPAVSKAGKPKWEFLNAKWFHYFFLFGLERNWVWRIARQSSRGEWISREKHFWLHGADYRPAEMLIAQCNSMQINDGQNEWS
jgi:hypothetical protein